MGNRKAQDKNNRQKPTFTFKVTAKLPAAFWGLMSGGASSAIILLYMR